MLLYGYRYIVWVLGDSGVVNVSKLDTSEWTGGARTRRVTNAL